MRKYYRFHCNKGFILISVLIATGLLLTMATGLAWYAKTSMLYISSAQFAVESRSVAETVLATIKTKISSDTNTYDSFSEKLYSPNEPLITEIGKYRIEAYVLPLDNLIPLKGLFLPDGITIKNEFQAPWEAIWKELELPDTAARAADFMDIDNVQSQGGAEKDTDINRIPLDISELLALDGVNTGTLWGKSNEQDTVLGLSDYFTIFGKDKININTAPAYIIALLDNRIDKSVADALVYYRLNHPIDKIDDLKSVPGFPSAVIAKITNIIDVKSNYFRIIINVTKGKDKNRNFKITVKKDKDTVHTVRWEE